MVLDIKEFTSELEYYKFISNMYYQTIEDVCTQLGCENDNEKILKAIAGLQDDQLQLICLESVGVDNWGGYDEAMKEYRQAKLYDTYEV